MGLAGSVGGVNRYVGCRQVVDPSAAADVVGGGARCSQLSGRRQLQDSVGEWSGDGHAESSPEQWPRWTPGC